MGESSKTPEKKQNKSSKKESSTTSKKRSKSESMRELSEIKQEKQKEAIQQDSNEDAKQNSKRAISLLDREEAIFDIMSKDPPSRKFPQLNNMYELLIEIAATYNMSLRHHNIATTDYNMRTLPADSIDSAPYSPLHIYISLVFEGFKQTHNSFEKRKDCHLYCWTLYLCEKVPDFAAITNIVQPNPNDGYLEWVDSLKTSLSKIYFWRIQIFMENLIQEKISWTGIEEKTPDINSILKHEILGVQGSFLKSAFQIAGLNSKREL
eukprot:c40612_g1_i1.p1 GENE.c40612_g1_i1~~c40612_g1_i1.p1  ORF type:complete len:265 (-),score=28.79 c40612_g1_i1:129-923(-)